MSGDAANAQECGPLLPPLPPLSSPDAPPVPALPAASHADPLETPPNPRRSSRADPLDPATRHAAQMMPLLLAQQTQATLSTAPSAPIDAQARASIEAILPDLVRKIAWSGDGKRGSMRMELGAGALAGATVVVHADDGRVRVELDAPAGTDVDAWREKLGQRLAMRGVAVDELIVA